MSKTRSREMLPFFILGGLFFVATGLVHPVTPTFFQMLELPHHMYGLATASASLMSFLFSPLLGKLNSMIPSRVTFSTFCLVYGTAQIAFSMARTPATILIARMIGGGVGGFAQLCLLTYVINTSLLEKRGSRLAIVATLMSVCSPFGYFIGGLVGELSIFYSFYLQAGVLVVCSVGAWVCMKNDMHTKEPPRLRSLARDINPFSVFIQCRNMIGGATMVLLTAVMLAFFASNVTDVNFNYYIKDQLGLGPGANGIIRAVVGVISLIANSTVCIWLMRRTDLKLSMAAVAALSSLAVLGVVYGGSTVLFMAIFYFALNSITWPILQALVAALGRNSEESNLAVGLYNSLMSIGSIIGAAIAGVAYLAAPQTPFLVGVGCYAVTAVLLLLYARLRKKEAARDAAEEPAAQ